MNEINKKIIITEKRANCYLAYDTKKYYLFKPNNKQYVTIPAEIKLNPDELEKNITDKETITSEEKLKTRLKVLMLSLEEAGIKENESFNVLHGLIFDLADVYYYSNDENNLDYRNERLNNITNEYIKNRLVKMSNVLVEDYYIDLYDKYVANLTHDSKEIQKKTVKEHVLKKIINQWGLKLVKNKITRDINDPDVRYYFTIKNHKFTNIYRPVDSIDLVKLINNVYGLEQGVFSRKNIMKALDFVDTEIHKNYDFIGFENGLLNVKTPREFITEAKEPVLPYLQHDTEYKNDTPTNIEDLKTKYGDTEFMQYVTSSLTEEDQMAFIEYLGYCMIAGNTETVIMYFVGVGGTGKSVALNLINIITSEQTNSLNLSKFCSNHGTDENVEVYNSLVAIDPDSSNDIIKTTKKLKQVSGGDRIRIRALYSNPFTAEPEEIAIIACAGNVLPKFSRLESADYDRFYFIEFNNKFRGTDQEKKNLKELLAKEKELIINICLNAYLKNGLSIKEKQSLTTKKDLYEKYSDPLVNAINNLVTISEIRDPDEFVYIKEFEDVILKYAETYKTPLDLNKNERLKRGALLKGIRKAFDLPDTYESDKTMDDIRYYKYLQPNDKYDEMLNLLDKE